MYFAQGRYAEAEPLYKRALAISEKALGPDHPDVGSSLNNLAMLYESQGRYAEAEPLYKRALAISEKALGPDHPDVGSSLNNLAMLYFVQRDWARAADFWRRSTGVIVRRAQRGTDDVGQALTGKRKGEAEQESDRFWGLVKAAHRLASQGSRRRSELAARDVPDSAVGARLGSSRLAGTDGGARRQGRSGAGGPRARAAGPGRGMAEAGRCSHRCRVASTRQAGSGSRGGQRCPACRHRCAHCRHRQAAEGRLPRLCRVRQPDAAVGGGRAGPAPSRRGAGAVPRHAGIEADTGRDLRLGCHQDRRALGALAISAPRR